MVSNYTNHYYNVTGNTSCLKYIIWRIYEYIYVYCRYIYVYVYLYCKVSVHKYINVSPRASLWIKLVYMCVNYIYRALADHKRPPVNPCILYLHSSHYFTVRYNVYPIQHVIIILIIKLKLKEKSTLPLDTQWKILWESTLKNLCWNFFKMMWWILTKEFRLK